MKIIPKLQTGGNIESLFTVWTPTQEPSGVEYSNSTRQPSSSSDKGDLTEKDFFSMLKDLNGLPNDMQSIAENLSSTFAISNLTGIAPQNLSTMYIQSLFQLRLAQQNKEYFDEAIKNASKNGSLAEPAISLDGGLIVQDSEGRINTVSLDTYFNNRDQYMPLTVSNLANMRKYDPQLVNNTSVFDIINNSVGFESFQDIIDKAQISLGSSKYSVKSVMDKRALQGLEYLQQLPKDKREEVFDQINNPTYSNTEESNVQQVRALMTYLQAVIPDRMKTWAAWKMQTSDKEAATRALIEQYLSGRYSTNKSQILTPGSSSKSSSGSGGSAEDPKLGYWGQVFAGIGGSEQPFTILNGNTLVSANGKYYSTTPGSDKNKSLTDYLNDSGAAYTIKNKNNITFGDQQISPDSYGDIVVNVNSGMMVTTLPITPEGKVDFSVLDTYTRLQNKLQEQGFKIGTPEFDNQMAKELNNEGLSYLVDAQNGTIDKTKFGEFAVFEGYTSDKAKMIQGNRKVGMRDLNTPYIIDSSKDDNIYNIIRQALSNKENGAYELDNRNWANPFDWGSTWYDKVYSANIFIPLNLNTVNAMNADKNDIKSSTAYQYESNMQDNQKRSIQKPTDSTML